MAPGFLGLTYRRPAQQPISITLPEYDDSQTDLGLKSTPSTLYGIPDALSFDRIMDGGTCPPCTIRDFLNYLIYIEHSAENLQFFLWYRSYVERFSSANTADLALAPEWTQEMQIETFTELQQERRGAMKRDPANVAAMFKGTDFDKKRNGGNDSPSSFGADTAGGGDPFATPPRTPWGNDSKSTLGSNAFTYRKEASEVFTAHDIKAPFTIQPFRAEIDRVIATYIAPDAPRQLNLSARERTHLLTALSRTTHPTAFRQAVHSVESTLRMQSHPNFLRWAICNGNPPRVVFATLLGAGLIVASLAAYIILVVAVAGLPRGMRAVPAVGMVLGVATLIAARKGMCVVLHGLHHRHVRPWELFVDEEVELPEKEEEGAQNYDKDACCLEVFGGGTGANSYEDEPWVVKYQKRNLVRKIFDREVWIQEPALRAIQDTIFVQAVLGALVITGCVTAIFVCVPGVHH